MKEKYEDIEYPRLAKGKMYKDYLAENKLKGYGKQGMPIFTEDERQNVEGAGSKSFNGKD